MSATQEDVLTARPATPPKEVTRELAEPLTKLHFADLRKGDVLLSRGVGRLSDLIAGMDNGRYSHAALFDGEHFVQATMKGVVASPPKIIREHQWFLDVFRFRTQDGRELDTTGLPSQPILTVANGFIGNDYAFDELALAAVVFVMRKSTAIPYMGKLLEILGGVGLSALRDFINKYVRKKKKGSLICTEVVVRSYWGAADNRGDPYGLHLDVMRRHGKLMAGQYTADEAEQYDQLVAEITAAFDEANPEISAQWDVARMPPLQSGGDNALAAIAGSKLFPAGCITPCDLQTSYSLQRVGRYDDWDQ